MRLIDIVKEVAEVVTLDKGQTITVSQFLTQFGFPPKQQHTPIEKLSGGERRRLQLLMVLIKNPNFLILDEPTNDLDLMTLNTLEEFLDSFPGCLIIVSHDRYFMDRLVEHLFVFEGEGAISDFPGNYSEFREIEKEQKDRGSKTEDRSIESTKSIQSEKVLIATAAPQVKVKAGFKQKNEFKEVNASIAKLEKEKSQLTEKISGGNSDHEELMKISARMLEIDSELEELELTWLELSELEGIE
jgi:ATP-binding cassette subfamily F protein uup